MTKFHSLKLGVVVALIAAGAMTVQAQMKAEAPAKPAASTMTYPPGTATAIFAGGCFWCSESDFEKVPGVLEVESGYTGGRTERPSYQEVSAGQTGHTEAVRVIYDPAKVSYRQLVEYHWRHIDPTVKDRQFCDVGSQYRSGIYWQNEAERQVVEASLKALKESGRFQNIYTEVAPATPFWLAEEYHQDYYKKNPLRYAYYRASCGRDQRIEKLWGKH
jgi:peptide-methionine (S)-S-oxide reductase